MAAVIFDLDDTLYPHERYINSGFSAVARHLGRRFRLSVDDVYGRLRAARDLGHRGREIQTMCGGYGLDDALAADLVHVFRHHRPEIWLSHDAAPALDALRALGWRIAILTNGLPSAQAAKVHALGLEARVDHVIYANEYAQGGKPAPEPFLEALRRLEATPESAVMVGDDRVNDVEGARAVGLRTVLVSRGPRPSEDGGADAVVSGLADVPRIVVELLQRRVADAA